MGEPGTTGLAAGTLRGARTGSGERSGLRGSVEFRKALRNDAYTHMFLVLPVGVALSLLGVEVLTGAAPLFPSLVEGANTTCR